MLRLPRPARPAPNATPAPSSPSPTTTSTAAAATAMNTPRTMLGHPGNIQDHSSKYQPTKYGLFLPTVAAVPPSQCHPSFTPPPAQMPCSDSVVGPPYGFMPSPASDRSPLTHQSLIHQSAQQPPLVVPPPPPYFPRQIKPTQTAPQPQGWSARLPFAPQFQPPPPPDLRQNPQARKPSQPQSLPATASDGASPPKKRKRIIPCSEWHSLISLQVHVLTASQLTATRTRKNAAQETHANTAKRRIESVNTPTRSLGSTRSIRIRRQRGGSPERVGTRLFLRW